MEFGKDRSLQDIENEYNRKLKEGEAALDRELQDIQKKHADEIAPLAREFSAKRTKLSSERDQGIRRLDDEERKEINKIKQRIQSEKAKLTHSTAQAIEELNKQSNKALEPHNIAIIEAMENSTKKKKELQTNLATWRDHGYEEIRVRMKKDEESKAKVDSSKVDAISAPAVSEG